MLFFPVFAKLQPGLFPSTSSGRLPRDPLSLLFATLTDSTPCKSFLCHSYENTGGVVELFPLWNLPLATFLLSLRSTSAKSTHELHIFSRQLLSLPHLRFPWGEGVYPARLSGTSPLLPAGRRFPPAQRGGPSRNRRLRPCRRVSTRLERLLSSTSHESSVTVSPRRTIAPKRPQCHNGFERSINATPGNISARPGV